MTVSTDRLRAAVRLAGQVLCAVGCLMVLRSVAAGTATDFVAPTAATSTASAPIGLTVALRWSRQPWAIRSASPSP